MIKDLVALANELKSSGQLSEFLKVLEVWNGLFNCSTNPVLAEGPRGNLYVRQMVADKIGTVVEGHKHNFDHTTYIISGKVLRKVWDVDVDGNEIPGTSKEEIFQAPAWMLIKKEKYHQFTALTENVILECVYAIRDSQTGEFSENWDGSKGPYV